MLKLDVGGESGPYGMLHTGSEFVMCLEGTIEYEVEGEKFILNPGDNMIFAAQLRHRWRNIGDGPASAVIVLAGFEQGERPSEYHLTSSMQADEESEPQS